MPCEGNVGGDEENFNPSLCNAGEDLCRQQMFRNFHKLISKEVHHGNIIGNSKRSNDYTVSYLREVPPEERNEGSIHRAERQAHHAAARSRVLSGFSWNFRNRWKERKRRATCEFIV